MPNVTVRPSVCLSVCLNAGLQARSLFASGDLHQGFLWFSSAAHQMLSRHTKSTSHCMLLAQPFYNKIQNCQWNAVFPTLQKFRHNSAVWTPNSTHTLNSFPQQRTPHSLIPTTLPSSLSNALPCLLPTFTRRTRGHWLGTFWAINLWVLSLPH